MIDIPLQRATHRRYLVLAAFCFAATLAYFHRSMLSVPAEQIQSDLQLTDSELGWVLGAIYFTYAVFQIPGGWLADRWGTRRALSLFVFTWSLATLFTGLPGGLLVLVSGRAICGAAQAGAFPCCVNSFKHWFPPLQRSRASGMLTAAMSVGSVLATASAGPFLELYDWRTLFIVAAIPGLLWAGWFWYWFRDTPAQHSGTNDAERHLIGIDATLVAATPDQASQRHAWATMASSPRMFLICAQHFFRAAGTVFFQTWFPVYLQQARGISLENSGWLASLPLVGIVIGSLLGGYLGDFILTHTGSRRLSRQGIALVSTLGCATCIAASTFVAAALPAVLLISLGMLLAGTSSPIAYTITIDLGGRHVGKVFSVMNTAGNLGGAAIPPVVGMIIDQTGQWNYVIALFVGIYLAAALCWIPLNPNGSLFSDDAAPQR
jgi:sugar phosphate permease